MSAPRHRSFGAVVACLIGFGLVAVAPAPADWLVTRDGFRIETQGPWQVRGRLVVFHRADGSLASMRADQLDLDASRRETAGRAHPQTPAPPASETAPKAETKARVVFTDRDFSHPGVGEGGTASGDTEHEAAASAVPAGGSSSAGQSPVTVTNWRNVSKPGDTGVELFGTLRNPTHDIANRVTVTAHLLDETGEKVGEGKAVLSQPSIPPGGIVNFRVRVPDVPVFSRVEFEIQSRPLTVAPAPADIPPGPGSGDRP